MEQYGNTSTFNIENVLVQNIKSSDYYVRKVLELESVYEVVDEIYNTYVWFYFPWSSVECKSISRLTIDIFCRVDNVEPWLSGNARGASSAFCLLFRLAELKPSPGEIREMLDSKDWVYIRAVCIDFFCLCFCWLLLDIITALISFSRSYSLLLHLYYNLQIGFLYLRYCCNPRDLWKWCSKYVTDTEVCMFLFWFCATTPNALYFTCCCRK